MGYHIVKGLLSIVGWILRGVWNLLFKPIFVWIEEAIILLLMKTGVSRLAARAILSAVMIGLILIIIILFS